MTAAQPTPIEDLWTVPQVMKFLNVKRTWVYDQVHKEALPHVWLGSRLRFEPAEVRAWVAKHRSTVPNATVLPISGARR